MSREALFADLVTPARRRAGGDAVLLGAPLVLVLAALGWRLGGSAAALAALAIAGAALAFIARTRAVRFDQSWLIRRLDASEAQLEDSAALLFAEQDFGPLARLQAERIAARVAALDPVTLAERRPTRRIAASWALGALAIAAILLWPARAETAAPLAPADPTAAATPGAPRLTGQRVTIAAPAYTGLPEQGSDSLDIRAPAGSRIAWTLRFAPQPQSAALQLVGGQTIPLARGEDGLWRASLRLDTPALYRITAPGLPAAAAPHRLEPIADAPPQVRAVEPASGLVMAQPGQRRWRVVFAATDDYAVASLARLTLTTATGEGENVRFTERSRSVTGTGAAKDRRFTIDLDLAAFSLQPGSDLVAQLTVADTRTPQPQQVRGPAVILRIPAPAPPQAEGLEMMAKQQMPAYFRSQRQIIIDTEALIKQRSKLSADDFLVRSDTIGVDQRLLRLRYGQFVGMEAEEAPPRPKLDLPTADKEEPAEEEHHEGDGHDHGSEESGSPVFGDLGNVLADYGHTHDESEAATLLDPKTRTLLKAALDEMWQAEVNLRTGKPEAALPFELRALDFIKQVQQASRIYLPRIGSQQPPIDMARRLTGKRAGIVSGGATLAPFALPDAVPATAWTTLATRETIDLAGLEAWVRSNAARVRDPLAVLAAIDGLRADQTSSTRREALRAQLWAVLTRPPAAVRRRHDGGVPGRRYAEGLR